MDAQEDIVHFVAIAFSILLVFDLSAESLNNKESYSGTEFNFNSIPE